MLSLILTLWPTFLHKSKVSTIQNEIALSQRFILTCIIICFVRNSLLFHCSFYNTHSLNLCLHHHAYLLIVFPWSCIYFDCISLPVLVTRLGHIKCTRSGGNSIGHQWTPPPPPPIQRAMLSFDVIFLLTKIKLMNRQPIWLQVWDAMTHMWRCCN